MDFLSFNFVGRFFSLLTCIYIWDGHLWDSWLYNVAPPSARMIPSASLAVSIRPSLIHPYVRIMIVLTLRRLAKIEVM